MVDRYGLSLNVTRGSLDNIPRTGPLILIANHPYGILDGLMMGHMLQSTRGDFRILANSVFRKAEDLNRILLPISFDNTKEALALNIETRKTALSYLSGGGAIGVFPGGTVSTALRPFSTPMDPGWRSFTARMIAKSDAAVVPVYFAGHTSRLFQVASHLHYTLRLGLLLKEFKTRYVAKYKVEPAVQESLGFVVGLALMEDIIGNAKSTSPADLAAVAKTIDLPGGTYINGWGMKFDATGQNVMAEGAVVQWQDQRMVVVYPDSVSMAKPIMVPLPGSN